MKIQFDKATLALDLNPQHVDDFYRAIKLLESATSFQLVFAQFNDPAYRNKLIGKINQIVSDAEMCEVQTLPDFQALQRCVTKLTETAKVVHVVGLEDWLHPEKDTTRIQGFNYQRESLAQTWRGVIFLWMTEWDIDAFAVHAPDLWAWRSAVLNFSTQASTMGHFEPSFSRKMSLKTKIKRINELESYLSDSSNIIENKIKGALLNELGYLLSEIGHNTKALIYYKQSLVIWRETGNRSGEGASLNNIALIYREQGQHELAMKFFQQSLVIRQEVGDRLEEGASLNNIALIHRDQGQHELAMKFFQQSLVIRQEARDRFGEGTTLNNIAAIYQERRQHELAMKFFHQSLVLRQEIGDRFGEGATLGNIAGSYQKLKQYKQAMECYRKSLTISQEVGNRSLEGYVLWNMALLYRAQGQRQKALDLFEQALQIQRSLNSPDYERDRTEVEGYRKQ